MTTVLDKPARKLFLIDLAQSTDVTDTVLTIEERSHSNKKWAANCFGKTIHFSVVTVQGVVIERKDDGDILLIDDGTGIALVKGCKRLPFHTTKPHKGHYIMVVGQLYQSGNVPVIRSVKVQNLSHNVAMATIWPLEVIDGLHQKVDD